MIDPVVQRLLDAQQQANTDLMHAAVQAQQDRFNAQLAATTDAIQREITALRAMQRAESLPASMPDLREAAKSIWPELADTPTPPLSWVEAPTISLALLGAAMICAILTCIVLYA
jgi:hypothetical protein